LFWTHQSQWFL